jgi:MFS family permease
VSSDLQHDKRRNINRQQWTFFAFFGIFELGSLICGLANSSAMLIGGRAIAGLGASGMMNGGMTIIAGAVPLQKRPGMLWLTLVPDYRDLILM